MSSDVSLKIFGCRGSIPVSGPKHSRYGGETSCAVVSVGDHDIVFDAGSGIRGYGAELNGSTDPRVHLFVTHAHFDHLIGLPYFAPMYRPDATVHMYGPCDPRQGQFRDTIDTIIRPPYHPVALFEMLATKHFHDVGEADVVYFLQGQTSPLQLRAGHPDHRADVPDADDVVAEVHCMRGYNHPKSGVNIYKVIAGDRTIVYATDTEGYVSGDQRLIKFAQGADLLIHDAMYTEEKYISMPVPTQGYGHSTVEIATAVANRASVGKLVLWHHDPTSTDDDLDEVGELAREKFADTIIGRDGLQIDL